MTMESISLLLICNDSKGNVGKLSGLNICDSKDDVRNAV